MHPKNPLYLLSKHKPLTPTRASFALLTLILQFPKGPHWRSAAESLGTEITSETISQGVPATWRWVRAGVGTESWSGQKPRCVCQTPGRGSQAALMPQSFAFRRSPAALHCGGEGRFWPLGRRIGDGVGMPFISLFCNETLGIVAKSTFHLTHSGEMKWFWSSVRAVWGSQQATTNTMRRFSLGQPILT